MYRTRNTSPVQYAVAGLTLAMMVQGTPASAQSSEAPDSAKARFTIGAVQSMAGYFRFNSPQLESRLAAAGLPSASGGAPTIGLGADIRMGRVLLGAGWQSMLARTQLGPAYRTKVAGDYALFDVGFAPVRRRSIAVYTISGLGITHFALNIKARGDFTFDDGLHSPGREVTVSGTSAIAHAGLLVERRFQRANGSEFALTARFGVVRSLGAQAWQSDDSQVREGPSGMRGSYLRIALSRPLRKRRDALVPVLGTVAQAVIH